MSTHLPSTESDPTHRPGQSWVTLVAGVLVLACVVVGGVSIYHAGYFSPGSGNSERAATAAAECQRIVAQAMQASGSYCDQIGPNSVCYGNFTLQAELVPGAADSFSQRGDTIDVQELRRLSATPLDLVTDEWGIAVFRVMANLPYSLPGESITMVVFGNTTIDTPNQSLESFYFTSELGQIVCEAVPFDGIMINVPDGTGIRFTVNGVDVILTGNASLEAVANQDLQIAVYDGSALVAVAGVEQVAGPGQGIRVPLGGPNGNEAVGPPSLYLLSADEITISCTLTGQHCTQAAIPTVGVDRVLADIASHLGPAPTLAQTETAAGTPGAATTATATGITAVGQPGPIETALPSTGLPPVSMPPPTGTPDLITICHCSEPDKCNQITIANTGSGGHWDHPYDIIPMPTEGCP